MENMILMYVNEIFHVVSHFPRYISCYIAENPFPLGQCSAPYVVWMGDIVYLIFDPELQVVYGVGVVADRLQVTGGGSSLAGQGSQLNNLLTKLNERIALVVLEKNR